MGKMEVSGKLDTSEACRVYIVGVPGDVIHGSCGGRGGGGGGGVERAMGTVGCPMDYKGPALRVTP